VPSVATAIPEGPEDGTPEWWQRELTNYLKTREEANRQFADPAFQLRLAEQSLANSTASREFQDEHGFINRGNLCYHWSETCAGDPWRYPGVDPFYDEVGNFTEVLFFDRDCARISGRVWAPLDAEPGDDLPGVVITNGSVQAPEPLYWWAAQALVRAGYVAMTYDPRGQGRSDTSTPDGTQGSNANPEVFWNGTVDAIDLFHSTPDQPYPHNETCAASVPAQYALPAAAPFNPHHAVLDRDRLGLAGHSLGATGVTTVQAMDPWEGRLAAENPVDVIVAWDSLRADFVPRVPAMGQSGEYGLVNVPFGTSPDPEDHKAAFTAWEEAGQPVMQFTIQGSTHYEWSLIPSRPVVNFSSTSWVDWGRPMAEHHTVAWFDRWLKLPHEPGYADADARLLDDAQFCERFSFYFRSARNFPDRAGTQHVDGDIRASCLAGDAASPANPDPDPDPGSDRGVDADADELPATGGGIGPYALVAVILAVGAASRRVRFRT
ncbi:MAG: hypothetical protein R3249_11870, partial [Nitriliruptorales bacterium]|nr:hypothetical protein [Nitriliruptorales bacterium]